MVKLTGNVDWAACDTAKVLGVRCWSAHLEDRLDPEGLVSVLCFGFTQFRHYPGSGWELRLEHQAPMNKAATEVRAAMMAILCCVYADGFASGVPDAIS